MNICSTNTALRGNCKSVAMNYNRRKFIKGMAVATAAIPFSNFVVSAGNGETPSKYPISFFTKHLDKYGPEFLMDTLKMAGLDGLDLTVRNKGCVLPENVEDDLPRMAEMAKSKGLLLEMMVSNIINTETPMAEKVLNTAAKNGIRHYRLGYYRYNNKQDAKQTINQAKTEMLALSELNKSIGIQGGYQNHSGNFFGAPMWDLLQVLQSIPSEFMSSQFDIRHAVCEGNKSWIVSMEMLANNIGSLAIKDFTWETMRGQAKVKSVPLGEGIVDFDLFFKNVKAQNIVAPITLHTEYPLLNKDEEQLSLLQKQKILVSKLKHDVDFIRNKLTQYQIN